MKMDDGRQRAQALVFFVLASSSAFGSVELEASAVGRRREGRWELAIAGRAKGIPEGGIVTLRFTRYENVVRWKDRAILTEPQGTPWIRKVYAEGGAFSHVESLATPSELQVEILFLPDDQEAPDLRKQMGLDYRPHRVVRSFRAGRAQDTAPQVRRDHAAFHDRTEDARRILRAMVAATDREELSKRKKELEKLLAKVRDDRTILTGSARAMGAILQDLYNAVGVMPKSEGEPKNDKGEHSGGTGGTTSSLTGEGLTLEKVAALVDEIRAIADREAALFLFREAAILLAESAEARKAKDWPRRKAVLEKDVSAVRSSWADLRIEIEGMGAHLDALASFWRATVAAVENGSPDPQPPDEEKAKKLEKVLRRV